MWAAQALRHFGYRRMAAWLALSESRGGDCGERCSSTFRDSENLDARRAVRLVRELRGGSA